MLSTRSGCSTLLIIWLLGSEEELVHRIASASASRSSSPKTDGMVEIGNTLNSKKKSKKFPASEIVGGDSRYILEPGNKDVIASLQVTVGVPLDSIEALFKNLGNMADESGSASPDTYNRPVQKANKIMEDNQDNFKGATDQLKGFIILVQEYLQQGQSKGKATFPKELIPVMARTDFSEIFKSLPDEDRGIVQSNLEKWVD